MRHYLPLFLLAFVISAHAEQSQWPVGSNVDRDIFCGAPGTETGRAYSRALHAALRELTAKGLSINEAMEALRARAKCPAGSQEPAKTEEAP